MICRNGNTQKERCIYMKKKITIRRFTAWLLSLVLLFCPVILSSCELDNETQNALFDFVIDILTDSAETSAEETETEFLPVSEPVDQPPEETETEVPSPTAESTDAPEETTEIITEELSESSILYDSYYYSKDDVAEYLHLYGELPKNYITKNEAMNRGWDSSKGNLWDVADGFCIGGDRFGNYEGLLPKSGKYKEADVNYNGGFRGADRLIFDENGSIWYTGDHYNTFEKIY